MAFDMFVESALGFFHRDFLYTPRTTFPNSDSVVFLDF